MEASGVIARNVTVVDADAVSATITAIVEVTLVALNRVKTDTAIVIP